MRRKNNKKKNEILSNLYNSGYDQIVSLKNNSNQRQIESDDSDSDSNTDNATSNGYDYLLSMKIWSLTKERVDKLRNDLLEMEKERDILANKSESVLYLNDLEALESALKENGNFEIPNRTYDVNANVCVELTKPTKKKSISKNITELRDSTNKITNHFKPEKCETSEDIPSDIYNDDRIYSLSLAERMRMCMNQSQNTRGNEITRNKNHDWAVINLEKANKNTKKNEKIILPDVDQEISVGDTEKNEDIILANNEEVSHKKKPQRRKNIVRNKKSVTLQNKDSSSNNIEKKHNKKRNKNVLVLDSDAESDIEFGNQLEITEKVSTLDTNKRRSRRNIAKVDYDIGTDTNSDNDDKEYDDCESDFSIDNSDNDD